MRIDTGWFHRPPAITTSIAAMGRPVELGEIRRREKLGRFDLGSSDAPRCVRVRRRRVAGGIHGMAEPGRQGQRQQLPSI